MSAADKVLAELNRHALTTAELLYALGTVHRFCGYAAAWMDVDQPGIRPIAAVIAIVAAVKGLEEVASAPDPREALSEMMTELPS